MQTVLIYIFIAAAVFYMGRRIYRMLTHKSSAGCEHCSANDIAGRTHTKAAPEK